MNIQALIDKAVDQIIKSVQVMIQKVRKESTKIYNGIVVSNNGDGRWNIRYNGEVHAVRLYGETPPMVDSTVKVFVPQGNQNLAWFIIPPIEGGGGGGGTSGVDSFNGRTGTVIGIAGDYTADMVGARPNTWLPTPDEIGAVPESTTVNGKSLSSNITLQASDVGAVPTSRTVNGQALNNDVTLTGSNIAASANDSTTIAAALLNKADRQLSNLDTPQLALANLGAGVRPNLLDNAYFVGGGSQQGRGQFPINQRGLMSVNSALQPLVDRWKTYRYVSGTATVVENGITLTGNFDFGETLERNRLPDKPNIPVTISALFSDGTLVSKTQILANNLFGETIVTAINSTDNLIFIRGWGSPETDLFFFRMNSGNSVTVAATKLEFGPTQTLAYQDEDGNWRLFEIPDYAEELAKCQRYFRRFPVNYAMGVLQSVSGIKNASFRYECNPPMRTTPVLLMQNQSDLTNAIDDGASAITPTKVVLGWRSNENVIGFYFEGASGNGGPGFVCNRYIDASAEL